MHPKLLFSSQLTTTVAAGACIHLDYLESQGPREIAGLGAIFDPVTGVLIDPPGFIATLQLLRGAASMLVAPPQSAAVEKDTNIRALA